MDPKNFQQMLRQQQFFNSVSMLSMHYPPEIINPFLERLQNTSFFQETFGHSGLPTSFQKSTNQGNNANNARGECYRAQMSQQEGLENSQKVARDILGQISAYPIFNEEQGPALNVPQASNQSFVNQGQALARDIRSIISEYPSPSFVNKGHSKVKGSHPLVHETSEDSQLMARKLKDMVSKYPTYIGQSTSKIEGTQTPIQEMSEDSKLVAKKLKDMVSRYSAYIDQSISKTANAQVNTHHSSAKINVREPNVSTQNNVLLTAPSRGPSNPHERPSANSAQLATQVLQRLQSQTLSSSQPTPKDPSKAKEPPHPQSQTKAMPATSSTKKSAKPAPSSRSQAGKLPKTAKPVEAVHKNEDTNKQTITTVKSSSSKQKLVSITTDKRVPSIQQVQAPQKTEKRVDTSSPVPKNPSGIPKVQITPQKSIQIIKVGTTAPRIELTPPTAIPSNTRKSTIQVEGLEKQKGSSQSKLEIKDFSTVRTPSSTSAIPTAVYDLGNMDRTYIEGVVGISGSYGTVNRSARK